MKIEADTICKVCTKIFCCSECCYKHVLKYHAIIVRVDMDAKKNEQININTATMSTNAVYWFCPICEKKPLMLQEEFCREMLEHIEMNHLPLKCRKCAKLYCKIDDLKQFSKCLYATVDIQERLQIECSAAERIGGTDASKDTIAKTQTTISTQTSPMLLPSNGHINKCKTINLNFKATGALTMVGQSNKEIGNEEFISDSVSSIKNMSSICSSASMRHSIDIVSKVKGTLVRSTSTPVQTEIICAKPKEQAFNGSSNGSQVSSIYNSGADFDNSPALPNSNGISPKRTENLNRLKVGGRPKISAVTPLRQVMSKSIQKAFAEHGGLPTTSRGTAAALYNRKVVFECSDFNYSSTNETPKSPLDLRLSPAVRRTQNEMYCGSAANTEQGPIAPRPIQSLRHEILLSSKKLTTESIVITRLQHLSNAESATSTTNVLPTKNSQGLSSLEIIPAASSSSLPADNGSSVLSTSNNSCSSVFKTCRSVEIITSTTELSEVNICEDSATYTKQKSNNLLSMQNIEENKVDLVVGLDKFLAPITPITRIPGACINKKVIEFVETPASIVEMAPLKSNCTTESPTNEVFFTPISTPVRKSSLQHHSSDGSSGEEFKRGLPRKLSSRFSPSRRPSLKDYAQSLANNRIDDVAENYEDEVFVPKEASSKKEDDKDNDSEIDKAAINATQSWSLGRLVGSVMRFPSLRGFDSRTTHKKDGIVDNKCNSLLKRCASMAGSLVRSKPLIDAAELNSLKRKRTNTIENHSTYLTPCGSDTSCNSSVSSKRFRIQGRKPIERMRTKS